MTVGVARAICACYAVNWSRLHQTAAWRSWPQRGLPVACCAGTRPPKMCCGASGHHAWPGSDC